MRAIITEIVLDSDYYLSLPTTLYHSQDIHYYVLEHIQTLGQVLQM